MICLNFWSGFYVNSDVSTFLLEASWKCSRLYMENLFKCGLFMQGREPAPD